MAMSWSIAAVSVVVAAISAARLTASNGVTRFAAGNDLLMALGMAAMALPATAVWFGTYGVWWASAFGVLVLAGIGMSVVRTREQGRHWAHHIIGSAAMLIMSLAMPGASSGPVLALGGHHMAGMPGMSSTEGMQGMEGMGHTQGMEGMAGMEGMDGMAMPGMTTGAAAPSSDSATMWRVVLAAFALYFLLSIVASVRARVRGTDQPAARRRGRPAGCSRCRTGSSSSWCP
ncbi:DUF5134 domain-containing protein [Streptomyces sp. Rer75]|uniref:DUF5134 domain-containing protein n=1 Tax=Streptomyces sp. Rer75 TaxID=2750011 RepID=UPI00211F1ABC|nr:DUF5134 domain-containing protein [Streptomyces sp. Rer75]